MKRNFNKNKADNRNFINVKQNRNSKKVMRSLGNVVKNKNGFNAKGNLETKNLNDPGLNEIIKDYFRVRECFKKVKNQKEALALLRKILKGTAPREINAMMDFLKNLLSAKSSKAQKINKNKTGIPRTNNDETTER